MLHDVMLWYNALRQGRASVIFFISANTLSL